MSAEQIATRDSAAGTPLRTRSRRFGEPGLHRRAAASNYPGGPDGKPRPHGLVMHVRPGIEWAPA